jgi:endonuclease/exonuclease/phosphatase family metal-dependent hydrolase
MEHHSKSGRTVFKFLPLCAKLIIAIGLLALALASCTRCTFPDIHPGRKNLTILTYNVDNLFDDIRNGTEYRDFDPESSSWDTVKYQKKLENIARVIKISARRGPDIVALQEVENRDVIDTLCGDFLAGLGYVESAIVQTGESAVQTAFLSKVPFESIRSHHINLPGATPLRNILEVEVLIGDTTLYIFNNHWKSKLGGAEETEELRRKQASQLALRVRQILRYDHNAEIIVLGDLNENIDEFERAGREYRTAIMPVDTAAIYDFPGTTIFIAEDIPMIEADTDRAVFYSPWGDASFPGSYVYKDRWETIDHILLSPGIMDEKDWVYESFSVVAEDFMIDERGQPRDWNGDFMSGYSDHLPLLLTLSYR